MSIFLFLFLTFRLKNPKKIVVFLFFLFFFSGKIIAHFNIFHFVLYLQLMPTSIYEQMHSSNEPRFIFSLTIKIRAWLISNCLLNLHPKIPMSTTNVLKSIFLWISWMKPSKNLKCLLNSHPKRC